MYETARQALVELADGRVLERVAVAVLRKRGYAGLRITSPTGDLGRDAYLRPLFGKRDEVVLLASCENGWSTKLDKDLAPYLKRSRGVQRPRKAIFATTQPTNEVTKERRKSLLRKATAARYGIKLEILDLNELAEELRTDELHRIAEYELGVRPRTRRPLRSVSEFRGRSALPGASAPLRGRHEEIARLGEMIVSPATTRAAVVLLTGPGGIGKTRLAVDVAADRAPTAIAPSSVSLTAEDLRDVPLNGRAVLIVDDAHRRPLAEIAALISDPAYNQVAVILTLRPGFGTVVERALGLEPDGTEHLRLGPLSDEDIDAIVLSYRIQHESFRLHIRDLVDGNPLLAHAACAVAVKHGQYGSDDTANIMRGLVERRLTHLEERPDQSTADHRRAAAVAVAIYAGARNCDRNALAALRGSINTLPSNDDDLEQVLLDLEEAELVEDTQRDDSTRPAAYVLRQRLAGPVLVADALTGNQRVRLRLDRTLLVLGRAAQFHPTTPGSDETIGAFGLPVPPNQNEAELGLGLDAHGLATQLSVLAQGADLAGHEPARALLARAVHELLAPNADIVAWLEVLTLASEVAPTAPNLIEWLHQRLVAQWPPTVDLFSEVHGGPDHYRSRVEQLVKDTAAHTERLARTVDVSQLVGWLLDTAWLATPAVFDRALELAKPGFSTLTGTFHARVAEPEQALFARRRVVLDATIAWISSRFEHDPDGLNSTEKSLRPPGLVVRLGLCALEPLLSTVTMEVGPSLTGRDHFSWAHYVLPDTPEAGELLGGAVDAVCAALDRLLDLSTDASVEREQHARDAVLTIAKTPYTLLGEHNRGLSSDDPLPDYARSLLAHEAERLQQYLVERWSRLPLAARYAAAERAAVLRGGGTLAGAVDSADPIATRASADPDLAALLVVAPVDHFGLGAPGEEQRAQTNAVELGGASSLAEAIAVLGALSETPQNMLVDFRQAYGRAAGAAADEAGQLLERLAQGRFPGDVPLLVGVAEAHPDAVQDWLLEHVRGDADVAELAITVSDVLSPAGAAAVLDAVFDAHVETKVGPTPHLTEVLASHLAVHHHRAFVQRLTRLRALAEHAQDASVDGVFRWIAVALRAARHDGASPLADSPELADELVAVLGRVLAVADTDLFLHSHHEHDGASAAAAMVRDAPAPMAALLWQRANDHPVRPIPAPWRMLLREVPFDERRPCGEALQGQLEAAGETSTEVREATDSLIRLLGRPTMTGPEGEPAPG